MALTTGNLVSHLNGVPEDDSELQTYLDAAQRHVERLLGYELANTDELPGGVPPDLEMAVLRLAADWYENREATISGTIIAPVPFGVTEIVNEHRRYTFGLCEDD